MPMVQPDPIEYLVGSRELTGQPLLPYDDGVCDFLQDLSASLLSLPASRDYPDVITFAFWCRRANLNRLKTEFTEAQNRLGLGVVLHVAPANVPVNFAFSYALGLLAGNANIVRVPSKSFRQVDLICEAMAPLLEEPQHAGIKVRTQLIRYPANDAVTASLSAECQGRVIWGGDATIQNIRRFPLTVRGVDVAFADRYSFCVLDAVTLQNLSEPEFKDLVQKFYNDTYVMDQNACSSPHLVVWLNLSSADKVPEKFWNALEQLVQSKYGFQTIHAVDKLTQLCRDAIELPTPPAFAHNGNLIYRLMLKDLPDHLEQLRGKNGYFYEYQAETLDSLVPVISSKFQTLTYFGVDKSRLKDFVLSNHLTGIDRIVPVGAGLDMDVVWDGYDLIRSLSRVISVK